MPIGVPKVPFRLPGEPAAQWVDLYNRLYRERVLFLCQELDDELGDKEPSFNDEEGPPIKQTNGMEDMSKDMSSELPAINPPDQKQEQ